jgi:hypothetical protein
MAMGWHVTVLRQDRRVAVWQAPVDGLRWLDDLVYSGDGRRSRSASRMNGSYKTLERRLKQMRAARRLGLSRRPRNSAWGMRAP